MYLDDVLRVLGRSNDEVAAVFRTGSRVYGTASEASDHDFVAILASPAAKQDLAFGKNVNVVIHGIATFRRAVADESVFALECLFLSPEHRLKEPMPRFTHVLDRHKLAASAIARSTSDLEKAKKRFADDASASKKKLFHALRVPMFALQIAKAGRIVDYGEANPIWRAIVDCDADTWEPFEARYRPIHARLCETLEATGRSKKR